MCPGGRRRHRHGCPEEADELRERAVRLVFESGRPIAHVARDLGMHPEACDSRSVGQRPTPARATIA
jgi:transposase